MTKSSDEFEARLAALEARNAELEQQVAALQAAAPKPAPAPPPVGRPVTIIHGASVRVPVEAMPDTEQLQHLQEIILRTYPILVPRGPEALPVNQFALQFRKCFEWLLTARRHDGLNTRYSVEHWINMAARFHGEREFGYKPFLAAVVAVGDCAYSTLDRLPYDLGVGLAEGPRGQSDLTAGWKRVLHEGGVLKPIALYSSAHTG